MTRKTWAVAGAIVLLTAAVAGGVEATSPSSHAAGTSNDPKFATAPVERGTLSDMLSQYGTLTYRSRPDGSPYSVIDRAAGIYTMLPSGGQGVGCGGVLYRVNEHPVVLLCGSTPAYRSLSKGAVGTDVEELNANLVRLGYASRAQLDPSSDVFGAATASALERLQKKLGEDQTGALALGRAVILPEAVRIAGVMGDLGGSARPGSRVLSATSDTLEVQLALDPSQLGEVKRGDRALITLPGNTAVTGRVARVSQTTDAAGATIPVHIRLDHPAQAGGLDHAPVQVEITTKGIRNALHVPVTAIVGRSGGGFSVDVVRADGRRDQVAVKLGLFDTAAGRVQVEGDLRAGDRVVVPSP